MRFLPLLLLLASIVSSEDQVPRVDSVSFFAGSSPLVFWTSGLSERVLVRTRIAGGGGERVVPVVVRVEWGLVPAGAPVDEELITWSAAQDLGVFELALGCGSEAEVLTTVRIARRVREWRDRGWDVVRCRATVTVAGALPESNALEVIPSGR